MATFHTESLKVLRGVRVGSQVPYLGRLTTLLKVGPVHPNTDSSFAWAVVLHTTSPTNTGHPFVVHDLYYDDELDLWVFSSGDYAETLEEALEAFARRVGEGGA